MKSELPPCMRVRRSSEEKSGEQETVIGEDVE